jgi:aryl-alcohol dehydrogenase-like predicted oxidoreductase
MPPSYFHRQAQGLTVSSLGLGTYLDSADYAGSVVAALEGGINFIDTSLNYRNQASERDIGEALARLKPARESFVVCTKAGYLVPNAVPDGIEIVANMHSMSPSFLLDQLDRSRANLRLDTIDVFYLHNPETQLQYIPEDEFYNRIQAAFETLEEQVANGKIRFYGIATWSGLRDKPGLSLERMASIAGEGNHFRFIQLPFNLGMVDGYPAIQEAQELGITSIASATLYQTRLLGRIPGEIAAKLPGASTDAQRAIQFTRSVPGITVALVGMGTPAHVAENLAVARLPPADLSAWFK